MKKNIKMRYPLYFKEFKCIGGSCEDTCCVGWDVDVDKITFKQYYKVQDNEMKKMFQKNVYNNDYYYSDEVDYGKVKLKKGKRCPFLDDHNYCVIYSKLGEEYLSNVCTSFPRITNKIDGYYEMSLDVACPEAARILLLKKEGIEFKESEETLGKHILSSVIDTKSKEFKNSPIKHLKEIRKRSIEIIKDRKFNLNQRLFILGDFLEKLEEKFNNNYKEGSEFINKYKINLSNGCLQNNKENYTFEVSFFKKMVDDLNVFKEVDSDSFKEYTKELIAGLDFNKTNTIKTYTDAYENGINTYFEEFINDNSYIFENYLVNFMYKNLFPFSETESIFDGYVMLLIRYAFIKFYLVGILLSKKETYSKEDTARFIQVFTKTIEHHKTYLVDVLEYIKENNLDNMDFGKKIL